MSIQITFNIAPGDDDMEKQIADHMRALGFVRRALSAPVGDVSQVALDNAAPANDLAREIASMVTLPDDATPKEVAEAFAGLSAAPKRERGRPSPGKKRRTAEEVAEDEAADRLDNLDREHEISRAEDLAQPPVEEAPQISSGEERVGPDDEQDAADEAAEVEEARDPEKPLTLEDLRAIVGEYAHKHGMAKAQADGQVIFKKVLGAPPEGVAGWMMSKVPTDQDTLQKLIAAIQEKF